MTGRTVFRLEQRVRVAGFAPARASSAAMRASNAASLPGAARIAFHSSQRSRA
jgi:hypothetical protein